MKSEFWQKNMFRYDLFETFRYLFVQNLKKKLVHTSSLIFYFIQNYFIISYLVHVQRDFFKSLAPVAVKRRWKLWEDNVM